MPLLEISDKSGGYDLRLPQWLKIRDVIEGEDQVKVQGSKYLPRPKGQKLSQYRAYKVRAVFYGVAERTLRGLVGLVFRIEPIVDLPTPIESLEQSATPDGRPLDTFMRDGIREVLSLGRWGVLVDMATQPKLPGEAIPYLAAYTAENIWRWEEVFDPLSGERKLVRVVVREDPLVADDQELTRLRELFLSPDGQYMQQLWIEMTDEEAAVSTRTDSTDGSGFQREGAPIVPTMQGEALDHIPFFFVNTFNMVPKPDKPPMLDLANMNLAHYRNSADYEHSLFLTGQPTPWASGNWADNEAPTQIGPGAFWQLPEGAAVGMLEYTGGSIQAVRTAIIDKEDRMAVLGAQLVRDQQRDNVTAETTRLQAHDEESVLLAAVGTTETAFRRILTFANEWAGGSGEVDVTLNRDFVETQLPAPELTAIIQGWQAGAYSRTTMHGNLQKGEIIPHNRTVEDEAELIETEAETMPPPVAPAGDPAAPGGFQLEGGGSIHASGKTSPGGEDGHVHRFELVVADDGTISGTALAETPDGQPLDHEHGIGRLDTTEEANGHSHPVPLGGPGGPAVEPEDEEPEAEE